MKSSENFQIYNVFFNNCLIIKIKYPISRHFLHYPDKEKKYFFQILLIVLLTNENYRFHRYRITAATTSSIILASISLSSISYLRSFKMTRI